MEQPTRSQRLKEQKQHDFQEHLEKNINSRAHHAKDSSSEEHKQLAQHHEEVHLTDPHPVQVSAHTSLDEGLTRAQRAHRSQRRRSRLHAGHAASESHEAEEDVSGESGSESGEEKIEKKPATDNIKAKEEKSVDKKEEKKEEEKKDEEKSKDNEEEKKEEASIKPEEASAVRGYLKETVGSLAEKLGNLTGIGFLKETGKELFESGKTELELAKGEDSKPTAEEVKEEVSDKAQEVKETMTDKAKEVKEMMTDKAQEAKEVISDKAAQMGKSLGVESEGLKEKGAREKAQ